jgi:oligopeptide/dipeptide ABC transporter ATP-binding protein
LREWRGRKVAYVFQEPGSALNPVFRVGHQVAECVRRADPGVDPRPVIRDLLTLTGLAEPDRVAASYPHQLSGGMQQRVMLAMALAGRPDLLIADEPTTALDVSVQAQILRLLRDLQARFSLSILLITHNLGVVAQAADRMVVMYGGQMVERGPVSAVLARPGHPYTRALLEAVPTLRGQRTRLAAIPGQIPAADRMPAGCAFAPRCGQTETICATTRPAPEAFGGEWVVRCHCLKSGK